MAYSYLVITKTDHRNRPRNIRIIGPNVDKYFAIPFSVLPDMFYRFDVIGKDCM